MPLTLYWLALGAFCIGTETFMIAPLLPAIAGELKVSIAAAGQLVTVFAITYAVASPLLSALFGNRDRKALLTVALAAFALANLLASLAQNFAQLLAAQFLLALSASIFMPGANTVAAMLVPPEKRGRAIAVVIGGLTVAMAFGVPIGSLVGRFADWRTSFTLVAAASVMGVLGLIVGLPRNLPRGAATLAERIAVARRPEILLALAVTALWATGVFSFYTFVAPFLTGPAGFDAATIPLILFMFGVAGWIGNMVGGRMADRHGPARTLAFSLSTLTLTYVAWGLVAYGGPSVLTMAVMLTGFATGGIAGWAFHPAQTSRLVHLAPDSPMVALSLNQSALYAGSAAGAALGALTVAHASLADLGWVAAACQLAALAVLMLGLRSARMKAPQPVAAE